MSGLHRWGVRDLSTCGPLSEGRDYRDPHPIKKKKRKKEEEEEVGVRECGRGAASVETLMRLDSRTPEGRVRACGAVLKRLIHIQTSQIRSAASGAAGAEGREVLLWG